MLKSLSRLVKETNISLISGKNTIIFENLFMRIYINQFTKYLTTKNLTSSLAILFIFLFLNSDSSYAQETTIKSEAAVFFQDEEKEEKAEASIPARYSDYYRICKNGYCTLKQYDKSKGEVSDECREDTVCFHFKCKDKSCQKVNEPGDNDKGCGSITDRCERKVCEEGQCKSKSGVDLEEGETSCEDFNDCQHLACEDFKCVLKQEPAPDSNDSSSDRKCRFPGEDCYNTICEAGACIKKNGFGSHECSETRNTLPPIISSLECTRLKCNPDTFTCERVNEKGSDECSLQDGEKSGCVHYECDPSNGTCIQKPGKGESTCEPGREEGVCWHRKCTSENECKRENSKGGHECENDWGENGCKHAKCSTGPTTSIKDNVCEEFDGPGIMGCDKDQLGKSETVCWRSWCDPLSVTGRCAYWPGAGGVGCREDSECLDLINRCREKLPNWPELPDFTNPFDKLEAKCRELLKEALDFSSNTTPSLPQDNINNIDINNARASLGENFRSSEITNKNSKKVIIEVYQDITCGMCVYAYNNLIPKINTSYANLDKVKIKYNQYPLFHAGKAFEFAKAAYCAEINGKQEDLLNILYSNSKEIKVEELSRYAKEIGINQENFSKCLASNEAINAVNLSIKKGEELGVKGTPTFFINGEKIAGAQPFEVFSEKIEEILAR